MKHGNYHNTSCRYCRSMDRTTMIIVAVVVISLWLLIYVTDTLPDEDRSILLFSIPVGSIITAALWRWLRQAIPQSHGWIYDKSGDTEWYKPNKSGIEVQDSKEE